MSKPPEGRMPPTAHGECGTPDSGGVAHYCTSAATLPPWSEHLPGNKNSSASNSSSRREPLKLSTWPLSKGWPLGTGSSCNPPGAQQLLKHSGLKLWSLVPPQHPGRPMTQKQALQMPGPPTLRSGCAPPGSPGHSRLHRSRTFKMRNRRPDTSCMPVRRAIFKFTSGPTNSRVQA